MPESSLSPEQAAEVFLNVLNNILKEMEELHVGLKKVETEVAALREDLATFEEQINEQGIPIDSESLLETLSMGLMLNGNNLPSGGPGGDVIFKQPFTTPRESWWPKYI